jgi:hypothetical protein
MVFNMDKFDDIDFDFPIEDEPENSKNLDDLISADDLAELSASLEKAQSAEPEPQTATSKTNAVITYELCLDSGVTVFRDMDSSGILTRFPVNGQQVICGLRDSRFLAWATRKFFLAERKEPKKSDLEGASRLLESLAWERPAIKVYNRIAEDGGAIFLDLANDNHDVARIDENGWQITNDAPWFRRPQTALPLPRPEHGGNLMMMKEFANVSQGDFVIMIGWLLAVFNLRGASPILSISSEFGSGKTTMLRLLEGLVDPHTDTELSLFKDEDSLISTACSRYVVPFGNLNNITPEKSDALCRLSTGGGLSKRKLYSDNDNFSASVKRPVILNGIELNLSRLDLLSRAFTITLKQISDYKDEDELFSKFETRRPKILGALLDAVSASLRDKSYSPKIQNRLVDAIRFIMRGERRGGLPWAVGTFEGAFNRMETSKREDALERDSAAQTVLSLAQGYGWKGTIKDLLGEVLRGAGSVEERRFLPATAHAMGRKLTELAPMLRLEGIQVERARIGGAYKVTIRTREN